MTPLAAESWPGRFGRAVERFNRRVLRFTRPGLRWFTASVKLGLIMKAAAVLVGVAVVAARSAFGQETPPSPFAAGRGILEVALLAMVLAPLFETAQIWLVHALTRRWLGLTGFVLVNTVLAYAGHVPTSSVPIAAAFVFSAMSYQYVSFRDDVGAGRGPGVHGRGREPRRLQQRTDADRGRRKHSGRADRVTSAIPARGPKPLFGAGV